MRFTEVLHQWQAQDRLQRALRSGRVPHAYLFAGPDGVGKEMLAERFAALLLCPQTRAAASPPDKTAAAGLPTWIETCGQCEDCILFGAGTHPDVHRIHRGLSKFHPDPAVRARKATVLGIDVIRHFLIERTGLFPSRGRAKVFVVPEAHLLSDESQNALLKTLEEPPDHTFLILLASSVETMLPTTRSRCHLVRFHPLPSAFVEEHLRKQHPAAPAAARFLAELSQGSLGIAIRGWHARLHEAIPVVIKAVADAPRDALGAGKALTELAEAVAQAFKGPTVTADEADDNEEIPAGAGRDAAAEDSATSGSISAAGSLLNPLREAQKTVLAMVTVVLRDTMRMAAGSTPVALPSDTAVTALARQTTPALAGQAIRAVSLAETQIDRSLNTQLVFDNVGIELGRAILPPSAPRRGQ